MWAILSYRDIFRVKVTRKNISNEMPEVLRLLYPETQEAVRNVTQIKKEIMRLRKSCEENISEKD